MLLRCPQCTHEFRSAEADPGMAGNMVRCPACGTRWLARRFDGDPYDYAASRHVRRDTPTDALVIEHISPSFARQSRREPPAAPRRSLDSRLAKGIGTLLIAVVGVFALRAPIVAALPRLPGALPAEVASLQFQRVRSETVGASGDSTLFVEGEILNTSSATVGLPAVRITLLSPGGSTVKSWLVEPTVTSLAAGRSIGFRSALASPPDEATQVTLNLAAREGT